MVVIPGLARQPPEKFSELPISSAPNAPGCRRRSVWNCSMPERMELISVWVEEILACVLTRLNAGSAIATRIAMIAMTTSSSTSVNPERVLARSA